MPGSTLSARCSERDRLVETIAALGEHVAERVERVGVHRIARDQVPERPLRAFDVTLVLQDERQHVQPADVVGVGRDELLRRGLRRVEILDDALTLGQQVRAGSGPSRPPGRRRSSACSRSRDSGARPADRSATARRLRDHRRTRVELLRLGQGVRRLVPLLVLFVDLGQAQLRPERARVVAEHLLERRDGARSAGPRPPEPSTSRIAASTSAG